MYFGATADVIDVLLLVVVFVVVMGLHSISSNIYLLE